MGHLKFLLFFSGVLPSVVLVTTLHIATIPLVGNNKELEFYIMFWGFAGFGSSITFGSHVHLVHYPFLHLDE